MSFKRCLHAMLVFTLVAGCGGDSDAGYQRPASVPAESRVVMPTNRGASNRLGEIFGGEHGVGFTTERKELHMLRPGREIVTKDISLSTCPMTGGYAAGVLHVLADRIIVHGDGCGLWALLDGDANPRAIASTHKVQSRVGGSGQEFDVELEEWTWEGGASGPTSWLWPQLAFRGDSLFMCVRPPPKSGSVLSAAQIWRTDIEGRGTPERIATLATSSCDVLLVDDDAIYVKNATPRTDEEIVGFPELFDRIDRKTGAVTRLARFDLDDGYMADHAMTATHLYVLESGVRGDQGFARIHRVAKSGGPTEVVAGELRYAYGLRSDGESVFVATERSILRVDGAAMTKVVESPSRLSHFAYAAGAGQLVWHEMGVEGDDRDDAIFAMPSKTTPAPR